MTVIVLREVFIKYLFLSVVLLLSACSFVEVQDYVHEPTDKLRDNITYNGSVRGIGDHQFIIVPYFREFSTSFSPNRAFLIVLSKNDVTINVTKISLRNLDNNYTEIITINNSFEISEPVAKSEYMRGYIPVFDRRYKNFNKFNQAKELELTITYSIAGNKKIMEVMTLKLVSRSEAAWVT